MSATSATTYQDLFHVIDADHNRELSLSEFTAFCETLPNPPSSSVVQRLFAQADVDDSGFIDETEFAALCDGVKMLVNLTEQQMADAYAIAELKRLFTYTAANGNVMRRDEVRKAADMLNEALQLRISNDAIAQTIRDVGSEDFDFPKFQQLVAKMAPGKSLGVVVSAFKEEEVRRKERLTRVKSLFEMRRGDKNGDNSDTRSLAHSPSRAFGQRGDAMAPADCPECAKRSRECDDLRKELSMVGQQLEEARHQLTSSSEKAALAEVEHKRLAGTVQNQLQVAEDRASAAERLVLNQADELEHATRRLSELEASLKQAEGNAEVAAAQGEELERAKSDTTQLRVELQQVTERLSIANQDLEAANAETAALQAKLDSHASEASRLNSVLDDLSHSKEKEVSKALRAVDEMKKACEEREAAAHKEEAHAQQLKQRVLARERELAKREDSVTKREHAVKEHDKMMREKWDKVFAATSAEQQQKELELNELQAEMSTRTAELQVREQLFESKTQRAESIGLGERERRLRMLQDIEKELCVRERNLRQAEANYVRQLALPELERLRQENKQLTETVDELKADRDGSSVFATMVPRALKKPPAPAMASAMRGGSGTATPMRRQPGVADGMMSPSYRLL